VISVDPACPPTAFLLYFVSLFEARLKPFSFLPPLVHVSAGQFVGRVDVVSGKKEVVSRFLDRLHNEDHETKEQREYEPE
jgi:hypothetical protein